MIPWLRMFGSLAIFVSFYWLVFSWLKQRDESEDFRVRLLKVSTLAGIFVWFVTETLSSFSRLTSAYVAGMWIGVVLLVMRLKRRRPVFPCTTSWIPGVIGAILFLLILIAWSAPPNNWDSMTYHMTRVAHWKAHANITFYPTHILRELYPYPFAEMLILHSVLLSGEDRLANFVQFLALVGCAVGASTIVKVWGGTIRSQWLSGLLVVTLPMGVLQATGTQNDLVTAFWLICFVAFVVLVPESTGFLLPAYAGASLGFAILTKPTAAIWALPFLTWYALKMLRKPRFVARVALTSLIVLAIVGPIALRNTQAFGSPAPRSLEGEDYAYSSSRHDVPGLLAVLAKNAALHVAAVPLPQWGVFVSESVLHFQKWLNVNQNDPELFWPGEFNPRFSRHEDDAGNFVHFCLAASAVFLVLLWRTPAAAAVRPYAICLVLGFALFSFLLRWQPWHSRLHVPIFMLSIPFIAIVAERLLPRIAETLLSVVLLIQAVPFLIGNASRPVFGSHSVFFKDRTSQVFINRPELQEPYEAVASALLATGCRNAGLIMIDGDTWEYPLWVLTDGKVTFEHVAVPRLLEDNRNLQPPCAVVTFEPSSTAVELQGHVYQKVLDRTPLSLWRQ